VPGRCVCVYVCVSTSPSWQLQEVVGVYLVDVYVFAHAFGRGGYLGDGLNQPL